MLGKWLKRLLVHPSQLSRNFAGDKPPKQQAPDIDGITVDKESIQRKIQQIKQRNAKEKLKQGSGEHPDLMPNYRINRLPEQILKFRRETNSENIFAYQDPAFEQKPVELQITEYANDYLMIDQRKLPPNLIMFANQVFCWEVEKASDVRLHHFDILKLISPKPEFLIVALPHPENLDKEAVDYLQKNFQNADILPLFEGIATYNNAAFDRINCVMFICTT